jgi:glycosyltransferase involved in cell wall biosynthesis
LGAAISPAVSIVLPTFNRREFIPPAIESVFAQTWTDWELIIADDGSEADTRAYLRALEDPPRVRVLYLPHTGRPAAVRNAALREAHGEFVAFLDSDDIWLPMKLQTQIASLRRHPSRKWSYTRFVLVDESGNPTAWARRTGGWPVPDGWILDELVTGKTALVLPSIMVRSDLLTEVGNFDEELVGSEDYELYLRLAAQSEVDAIDTTLTLVRRHTQHFSGQGVIPFESNVRIIEKLLRSGAVEHLHPFLLEQRAELAAGLARAHAGSGKRISALRTLCSSARYSWRYPRWWSGALGATAWAFTPEPVRSLARRYRSRWKAQA